MIILRPRIQNKSVPSEQTQGQPQPEEEDWRRSTHNEMQTLCHAAAAANGTSSVVCVQRVQRCKIGAEQTFAIATMFAE